MLGGRARERSHANTTCRDGNDDQTRLTGRHTGDKLACLLGPVIFLHFKPILAQRRNWEQIWASGLWPSRWAAQAVLKQLSQLPTMGGSGIVTQKQSIAGPPVANICAALPPGLSHLFSEGATSRQEETAARRRES